MTREEAIDLLDNLIGAVEDNHGSDYDGALKMAIKALEREPFINKPCVSIGACKYDKNKAFDKLRAEIDRKQYDFMESKDYDEGVRFGLMLAYQIIDKYKTESEE